MQHTTAPLQAPAGDPLTKLGLRDINPGTWSGSHGWSKHLQGPLIDSINPATGGVTAREHCATEAD